jgi:Fur family ferric uptake transcriptional regulator
VHLVCRDCGAVDEVDSAVVADTVSRLSVERGFAVDVGHFAIFGRCAACTASPD